jgi:radial spoke head protein 3
VSRSSLFKTSVIMASYSFNSEPRVVNQRTDKYRPESRSSKTSKLTNPLSGSKSDFKSKLTPQEQEKAQIEKQKELKQQEMMKTQLEAFKKSKIKQTPYDIRPAAPPRIEVDLQYFLTDQHDSQRSESTVDTQTDTFLPKPPSPKYVPKKTGIDAETQIWDGDLFNFNREVQPILNVIVSKTIEQALLEVEEETEMEAMSIYKMQNTERKREERADWEKELRAEIERINSKTAEVERARVIHNKKLNLIRKIQNLQLAKTYLSKLGPNTITRLQELNLHPDTFPHQLHYHYLSWLVDHTQRYVQARLERDQLFDSLYTTAQSNIIGSRKDLIISYKDRAAKKQIKGLNNSPNSRYIRFIYYNPMFGPATEFVSRLHAYINGEPYVQSDIDVQLITDSKPKTPKDSNMSRSLTKQVEEIPPEPIAIELEPPKYKTILVDDIRKISLGVANNPYFETVKDRRKYTFHAELYSETGLLIEAVDVNSSSASKGIKICTNCRDLTQKTSDDEKLVIDLKALPREVNHILFYIKTLRNNEEFKYARYNLQDYETSQPIDIGDMKAEFAEEDEEGPVPPLFLAYRIYKQEPNPRGLKVNLSSTEEAEVIMPEYPQHWLLEIYKLPIKMRIEKLSNVIQSIIRDGYDYLQNFTDQLIKFREYKIREQIEYRKRLEDIEAKNKKKKSKKKRTEVKLQEPSPAMQYIEPDPGYPTRTFGPFMLKDLDRMSVEQVYEIVSSGIDSELLSSLNQGLLLKVRDHDLTVSSHILRARTLQELLIVEKPAPRVMTASSRAKSRKSKSSSSSSSDED